MSPVYTSGITPNSSYVTSIYFSVCVKHKTEAFVPSRWPGGALKDILYFIFETYNTCTTPVSDHVLT